MEQRADDDNPNSFAALFENSMAKMERLQPGQKVETTVVSISNDCVFLQMSGKSEGVLDRAELTDKDGKLSVKEGDPITVYFLHAKNGEMVFTSKIGGEKAVPAVLEQAFKNRIPVEGLVEKEIKGGFDVKLGETRAFCPYSQMGLRRVEDAGVYVGQRLTFLIQEFKDNGRSILVSNRAVLEEAQKAKIDELKQSLKEGMVVKGPITSVQDFGAFVDLGGVQALLPVSEIARERVEDIRAVLSVGQEIEATILRLDWKGERISLSMKSLLADPWDGAAEKYPKGSKHTGKVVRVADFGAFVSLESGLDGLVHISEFKTDGARSASVPVKKGDSIVVQVLDVDSGARRISLKPTSSLEQDATTRKYLDDDSGGDTYNPFAELLKKKKK